MNGEIHLRVESLREPGLYLFFDDGTLLPVTRSSIEEWIQRYLADPTLISPACRAAAAYQPCQVCPRRHTGELCHAVPTVFPFLGSLDHYLSFDSVTAVFVEETGLAGRSEPVFHVTRTTMQRALQHVAILSLLYYCEIGRAYYPFFEGVVPFMHAEMIAERVYANLYLQLKGNSQAIQETLARMYEDMDSTILCQIERLRLFCVNDVLLNAFANLHVVLQYLSPDFLPSLLQQMEARRLAHAPTAAE